MGQERQQPFHKHKETVMGKCIIQVSFDLIAQALGVTDQDIRFIGVRASEPFAKSAEFFVEGEAVPQEPGPVLPTRTMTITRRALDVKII